MEIEEKIKKRISSLLSSADILRHGNEYGQTKSDQHQQDCIGWLVAAQNIIHLLVENAENPYRTTSDRICDQEAGLCVHDSVGELSVILKNLVDDIEAGLLVSVQDQAQAAVFDDFLDHAKSYVSNSMKNEAGVIAGVVFEDTLRKICRNSEIEEIGEKLDSLISTLSKKDILSAVKAKRARVAADVRTKATHAQWDGFEMNDVEVTIQFTEELIEKHLDS
ncbi:MAG: hypothetical protein BMS9Abin33_0614 [Gammaproteobacteria bacterium]|nr:MAG: hypothetical protein BMS9Abin33_0614 [Gammaproteobacteria bacterium]